jgi:hypothetical protein
VAQDMTSQNAAIPADMLEISTPAPHPATLKQKSILTDGLRESLSHFSCKFELHEAQTVVKHVNTGVI